MFLGLKLHTAEVFIGTETHSLACPPHSWGFTTEWENKCDQSQFSPYQDAIQDGLNKLQKYYSHLDQKLAYVLSLGAHHFISKKFTLMTSHCCSRSTSSILQNGLYFTQWRFSKMWYVLNLHCVLVLNFIQMEMYYAQPTMTGNSKMVKVPAKPPSTTVPSSFDQHHKTLIMLKVEEGWQNELRQYLRDHPKNVTRHTDIIKWWQVHSLYYILLWYHPLTTSRTMGRDIWHSPRSHSVFWQSWHPLSLASIFSPLGSTSQLMIVHVLGPIGLNSSRYWSQLGGLTFLILWLGIQLWLRRLRHQTWWWNIKNCLLSMMKLLNGTRSSLY